MELRIHKSAFGGKILSELKPFDILHIEGWKLTGDFSLDNDEYYYFLFDRDIDPNECFDTLEDQHVWNGCPQIGDKCKCGKRHWVHDYTKELS